MLAVVGGQRAQPVRGEELGLVEELGEQPLQPVDADDAEQQRRGAPGSPRSSPSVGELLPVVAGPRRSRKPREALADRQRPVEHRLVDDRRRPASG